jgi:hypothetical protein
MIRLREVGTSFHTKVRDARLVGDMLHFTEDGAAQALTGVTHVIAAIGALPNLDVLAAVEASGMPFTLVGDANQPGDFLSVLRDASMVGLALASDPRRSNDRSGESAAQTRPDHDPSERIMVQGCSLYDRSKWHE